LNQNDKEQVRKEISSNLFKEYKHNPATIPHVVQVILIHYGKLDFVGTTAGIHGAKDNQIIVAFINREGGPGCKVGSNIIITPISIAGAFVKTEGIAVPPFPNHI